MTDIEVKMKEMVQYYGEKVAVNTLDLDDSNTIETILYKLSGCYYLLILIGGESRHLIFMG